MKHPPFTSLPPSLPSPPLPPSPLAALLPSALPPPRSSLQLLQPFSSSALFTAALLLSALQPFSPSALSSSALSGAPSPLIAADFENGSPPTGADLNKLTAATDTTHARSGHSSLRITSEPKATWGYLAFELDGKLDFDANYEFSVWVYAEPGANAPKISAYLSADDGHDGRYTSVSGIGAITPGEWSQLRGFMYAGDWRRNHTAHRFIIRVNGTCWIDDLHFAPDPRETPAQIWPKLKLALHAAADTHVSLLAPGATLTLDARHAALAPDTARVEVLLPAAATTAPAATPAPPTGAAAPPIQNPESKIQNLSVPPDALLTFALDALDALDLTGTLELHHPTPAPHPTSATPTSPPAPRRGSAQSKIEYRAKRHHHPKSKIPAPHPAPATPAAGAAAPQSKIENPKSQIFSPALRATILADDTVIAAPTIKTVVPWQAIRVPRGGRTIFGLPPGLAGERPPAAIPLAPFRLAKGRHYITIAGPHIRPAGTFVKLELRAAPRPAEKPLHTFALLSDIHLSFNRREWRNTMSGAPSGAQLETVLRQLKREDPAAFAIIAGDLTDDARHAQYQELAAIVERAALPVYACIGNHDTLLPDSRKSIATAIPRLFPTDPKNTDYTFTRPPLRYIVLDGSHWRDPSGQIHPVKTTPADQTTLRAGAHDWLRATLAADTTTPTIIISHYPIYFARGVSPVSGYDRGKPYHDEKLTTILEAAPNIIAALSGHLHHNETAERAGITYLQNPAFAEWPNAYRLFRVYKDRLEWEIRQLPNRGLIREGVIPETALLWQLSTAPGDLAGTIPLKTTNKIISVY